MPSPGNKSCLVVLTGGRRHMVAMAVRRAQMEAEIPGGHDQKCLLFHLVLARSEPPMVHHGIPCHFPEVFTTEPEQCDGRFLASLS